MCFVCLKIKVLYISVQRTYWKPNHSCYRLEQQVIRTDFTNEFVGIVLYFVLDFSFKGIPKPKL